MSPSSGEPFSMPSGSEINPSSKWLRISAGDLAIRNLSGWAAAMASTPSINRSAVSRERFSASCEAGV